MEKVSEWITEWIKNENEEDKNNSTSK